MFKILFKKKTKKTRNGDSSYLLFTVNSSRERWVYCDANCVQHSMLSSRCHSVFKLVFKSAAVVIHSDQRVEVL